MAFKDLACSVGAEKDHLCLACYIFDSYHMQVPFSILASYDAR